MRTQNRENTDYQRGKISPKCISLKYQQTEVDGRQEGQENKTRTLRIKCVGNQDNRGRTAKTEEDKRGRTEQVHPTETFAGAPESADSDTMDILETDAYDRRQRRNMVPFTLMYSFWSNAVYVTTTFFMWVWTK